ncbi:MAG: hypothetical protein ACOX1X_01930 [Dethiobacteria bacterium]
MSENDAARVTGAPESACLRVTAMPEMTGFRSRWPAVVPRKRQSGPLGRSAWRPGKATRFLGIVVPNTWTCPPGQHGTMLQQYFTSTSHKDRPRGW